MLPGHTASDDIGDAVTHRLGSSVAEIIQHMFEHAGWPEPPHYGSFFVCFFVICGVQSEASDSADAEPAHNAGLVCDNGKHIGCVLVSRQRLVVMSPRTSIPFARAVLWSYPRILPSMLFIWQTASVEKELVSNG